jgi:hypothetical protein
MNRWRLSPVPLQCMCRETATGPVLMHRARLILTNGVSAPTECATCKRMMSDAGLEVKRHV